MSRRASVVLAAITGSLFVIGLAAQDCQDHPRDELSPLRVFRAGPAGPAYFRDGFDSPPYRFGEARGGWAVLGVVDGEYRLVLEPGSSAQLIRTSGETMTAVDVAATFEQVSGLPSARYGVGCFLGPERGYFVRMTQEGRVGIASVNGQTGGRDLTSMIPRTDVDLAGPNRLRLVCVPDEDGLTVGAWVNDVPLVSVHDSTASLAVIGVGIAVNAPHGVELHVDELVARPVDEGALDRLPGVGELSGDEPQVYAAHGVTFWYPAGWSVRDSHVRLPGGLDEMWAVTSSELGGSHRHEGLDVVTSSAEEATARGVVTARVGAYAGRLDGTMRGPEEVLVGGVGGSAGVIGYTRYGRAFELRLIVVVRDGIAYQLSCRYDPGDATTAAGCDLIVDSFRFTGG